MGRRRRGTVGGALRVLLLPVIAVLALVLFSTAMDNLNAGRSAEDLQQLETAVRRACVACYAAEGSYPEDLTYLEERYGLQIDETRYVVHYDVFASNLMPDIAVMELEK